jgi:AcrR family transcriptional regulator
MTTSDHRPIDPRSAATRAKLLQGTLACLRSRGLAGTTSRDIAAAAGVNVAAITYHYGSKDELVSQALLQAVRAWLEPAQQVLARAAGAPASIALEAIELLRRSFDEASELLPAYFEALLQAPRRASLRQGVEQLLGELRVLLRAGMQRQQAAGLLPAWVEPDSMAALFLALADGVALHAALGPVSVDHAAIAGQVAHLLLAAQDG